MVLIRFRDDGGCEVYDMSTGRLYYLPPNVDFPKVINKIISESKKQKEYLPFCKIFPARWGHYELHHKKKGLKYDISFR